MTEEVAREIDRILPIGWAHGDRTMKASGLALSVIAKKGIWICLKLHCLMAVLAKR